METMLGTSLYSCLYLKLAKTICLSYYHLCFLFNKIREEEDWTGSARRGGGDKTMYIHVSKFKNDKIKEEKNSKKITKHKIELNDSSKILMCM
jgi:hypothetical protein